MGKPIITYRKSDLYETFVDKHSVFDSSYDFLVFLAVVGYRENAPKRQNYRGDREAGTRGEIGLQNVYSNELYRSFMACLAFQDENDSAALVDRSQQMKTLAQYAAGGLEILEAELGDVAGDPTDALINYIETEANGPGRRGEELTTIVKAFDDQMMETS